jgi:Methyltransferase domain
MSDQTVSARALEFHPWDAMAPAALAGIERRGPFQFSAETGCGGSTIVFSQISGQHTAFALEGADRTISGLRAHADLRGERVVFVEGETRCTLPLHVFADRLDLVLLDGPHAYPLPQLEFVYLFPQVRVGGWMVLDDIQIPSVHELFRFMKMESCVELEEVVVRTAFFRKVGEGAAGPDDWQRQGLNARSVLRYSWRNRLREIIRRT